MKKIGKWIMNILISFDQLGNSILAGDSDETISSRIGKMQKGYGGTIPWRRPFIKVTCDILNAIDRNHCIDAIEEDEGKDAVGRVK